ncbi:hypothetical protein [Streptomyces tauricus]|uniref:hypothetical protein n=1 Tax=Streptomyces tauricus TaxID=68274 RepID=UPI0033BB6AB0
MQPIADDAPTEAAKLALALRDLHRRSGIPMSRLSQVSGIPKSTLYHAISGHRVPTVETVLAFVGACLPAVLRPESENPRDGAELSDRPTLPRITSDTRKYWTEMVDRALRERALRERQMNSDLPTQVAASVDRSAVGINPAYREYPPVRVADAAAVLDRALARLEQATRDVTWARAVLAEAAAAARPTPEIQRKPGERNAASRTALYDLAVKRQFTGDREGADAAARQAAEQGDITALYALSQLRETLGDREGADAAARQAAEHGDTNAQEMLADRRDLSGSQLSVATHDMVRADDVADDVDSLTGREEDA